MYNIQILTKQQNTHSFQTPNLEAFLKILNENKFIIHDPHSGTFIPLSEIALITYKKLQEQETPPASTTLPPPSQNCYDDSLECEMTTSQNLYQETTNPNSEKIKSECT